MIGILLHNNEYIDKKIVNLFSLIDKKFILMDKFDPKNPINIEGIFIDWVPKTSDNEVAWMKQASLLQTYIKTDVPIVIYDRYLSLTEKEIKWCKKFDVILFEPYLNSNREGGLYLPEWIDHFDIKYEFEEREYDLVYCCDKIEYKIKEFDKWIKNYSRVFNDKKVAYSTYEISDFLKQDYNDNNLIFVNNMPLYHLGNTTVAFHKKKSYKMGYFDPMYFHAMNLGCLPLLPVDHKYFHGLFKGLVISDLKEMDFYISTFSKVRDVLIEEIFDRIETNWSEFKINYAIDMIRRCYE